RWTGALRLGLLDRFGDIFRIVPLFHVPRVPPVRLKSFRNVFGKAQTGRPCQRDVVLVVEVDQLPEPEMASKRRGFLRDSLHQIAVAANRVRVVIDDGMPWTVVAGGEPSFRDRDS